MSQSRLSVIRGAALHRDGADTYPQIVLSKPITMSSAHVSLHEVIQLCEALGINTSIEAEDAKLSLTVITGRFCNTAAQLLQLAASIPEATRRGSPSSLRVSFPIDNSILARVVCALVPVVTMELQASADRKRRRPEDALDTRDERASVLAYHGVTERYDNEKSYFEYLSASDTRREMFKLHRMFKPLGFAYQVAHKSWSRSERLGNKPDDQSLLRQLRALMAMGVSVASLRKTRTPEQNSALDYVGLDVVDDGSLHPLTPTQGACRGASAAAAMSPTTREARTVQPWDLTDGEDTRGDASARAVDVITTTTTTGAEACVSCLLPQAHVVSAGAPAVSAPTHDISAASPARHPNTHSASVVAYNTPTRSSPHVIIYPALNTASSVSATRHAGRIASR